MAKGRQEQPSAAIFDSRMLQSTPESGERAGWDGAKRKKGSKTHIAVDALVYMLALFETPANEQYRAQVEELVLQVQEFTQQSVEVAFFDRDMADTSRPRLPNRRASNCRCSSCRRPRKALYCCPDAGWSNARLVWLLASAAWPAIMSACPRPSMASPFWLLPC